MTVVDTHDDRRLFERYSVRFPLRCQNDESSFETRLFFNNFSASGLRFFSKDRFYLNDNLSLEVVLPNSAAPLVLNGEVVWCRPHAEGMWDVGLQFHRVDLMHVQRLFQSCLDASST